MLVKNFWFIAALLFTPYVAAQVSSGTAFAVAPGLLATNQHVVAGCSSVDVLAADGRRAGAVVDADALIDLALIRVTGLKGATARLRSPRNVRLGEAVMVFGFPLSGSLSSGGNFTSGHVSALRGLRDAAGERQITAPVQPGNSGGPVMDASGLVVGVVQAKLDALRTAIKTGDIPQNVNFAVSLDVLAEFLSKNKVNVRDASPAKPLDTASVAELAQSFTYRVECRGKTQQALTPPSATMPRQPPSPSPLLYTGTLAKIKETGVVKIGFREASIPLSYLAYAGQPMGYSIDICQKVVDAIKFEIQLQSLRLEFVPVTSQTRIPILNSGNIDLECGATTNSVYRQKQVAFALTHFLTGTKIIVKKNSSIKSYDDLRDKNVVVTSGTINERAMKAYNNEKGLGINFIPSRDHAESFLALVTGRAEAFAMDDILLASLKASSRNPNDYEIIGEFLSEDPYAIMMRKDDPAFKKIVDDVVSNLYKSGEINRIYAKWFQSPIPPRGINFAFPMSDELKRIMSYPNDKGVEGCGKLNC